MPSRSHDSRPTRFSPSAAASDPVGPDAAVPVFDSCQLLGKRGAAIIEHEGKRYQLRRTRAGKLILTK
ncbi:MAG: hemin uptake protein HemP [Pseudomonadota bacterium]|nr:MAG: hemin uptake protein HemP [Pseudomonadota bacterium]